MKIEKNTTDDGDIMILLFIIINSGKGITSEGPFYSYKD
jgi:hypothetical protein